MPQTITVPSGLRTSEGVLAINNSEEMLGVIHEVIQRIPELQFFAASPCTKNEYNSLIVTGLPAVGFRKVGKYRTFDDAKLKNQTTKCENLDASWEIEKALATQNDRGKEFAFALQTKTHLESAFFTVARQIWYGPDADSEGFLGLAPFIDGLDEYTVDAGGTGSNLTSVFAVSSSEETLQLAWGNEGRIQEGEVLEQLITKVVVENEKEVLKGKWHYAQSIEGYCGLQIGAKWCAGRITNISPTKGLTDELIFELLSKFPSGKQPQALFLTPRSREQLRKSRTAVNATGAPAPTPEEVGGVQLVATDAISNNEELFA